MFKKKLNLIFIGIVLILFGFLISIISIDTVRSQIAEKVGITIAQEPPGVGPIQWNNAKDVFYGDAQINGLPAIGNYLWDPNLENWNRWRGTIAGGAYVNVIGMPALVGGKTPADAYANPADAVGTWALMGAYNGATWDEVRGSIANGLLVDITRSVNLPVYTTISSTLTTAQIAVGAGVGGTLIRAINLNRRSIIVRNQDAQVDMYVGAINVTIATGLLVKAGESLTLDRNTAAIYGITAAANITVGYLEE